MEIVYFKPRQKCRKDDVVYQNDTDMPGKRNSECSQ